MGEGGGGGIATVAIANHVLATVAIESTAIATVALTNVPNQPLPL